LTKYKENMRILLVEDEGKMASFIKRGLEEERYVVDIASNGEKALFLAETNPYDLIILDVMLPDTTGFSICKDLRSQKIDTFILMLTARDDVKDKVLGLETGADDYLVKPFDFDELLARIAALLRRKRLDKNPILKVADLELNQLTHKIIRAQKEINLTSKEYSLLEYLMLHANQVVTRTEISEHVWNEDFDSLTNIIDVFINRLRNKVDRGFKKELIHSLRGTGYMLKE
jgi:heavy metal response regulator